MRTSVPTSGTEVRETGQPDRVETRGRPSPPSVVRAGAVFAGKGAIVLERHHRARLHVDALSVTGEGRFADVFREHTRGVAFVDEHAVGSRRSVRLRQIALRYRRYLGARGACALHDVRGRRAGFTDAVSDRRTSAPASTSSASASSGPCTCTGPTCTGPACTGPGRTGPGRTGRVRIGRGTCRTQQETEQHTDSCYQGPHSPGSKATTVPRAS